MNKIENNIYFSNLRKTEKGKTKKKKKNTIIVLCFDIGDITFLSLILTKKAIINFLQRLRLYS